jgi:hypothetical protein
VLNAAVLADYLVSSFIMRFVGFALAQVGSIAGPEALVMIAKRAEDLGTSEAERVILR